MDIVPAICEQIGITKYEELSLALEKKNEDNHTTKCKPP